MNSTVRKTLATLLIASTASLGLPISAQADIGVRDTARQQLITHGVLPSDAQARIAAMTDEEAATVAQRIDELPAGGNRMAAVMGVMAIAGGVAIFLVALPFIIVGGAVALAIKSSRSGGSAAVETAPVAPAENP